MLCLHIASYKTIRDNQVLPVAAKADDVYRNEPLEATIKATLAFHGKTEADIISITGNTGQRDTGSWDFWLFVRGDAPT